MAGKKILYLHGFASSGQNGTVRTLRTLLPKAEILAPDIPVEPSKATEMLENLCKNEKPDLIVGTSMGGMYAEQLRGYWRILVNPSFTPAETILKNNGLGKQDFHNPRADGQTSFLVNKALLEEYRECASRCFQDCEAEDEKVYGLFGINDSVVHGFDLFSSHYSKAIRFDGEHYMNDSTVLHSVLPVIQWIDDRQEGRSRKVVLVSITDTLADNDHQAVHGRSYLDTDPKPSAVKVYRKLCESYDCHIVESAPYNSPDSWPDVVKWTEKNIGVVAWNRVTVTNRKDLVMGDYLIDRHDDRCGAQDFMGTVIKFGEEPFKDWDEVLTYFARLGGQ